MLLLLSTFLCFSLDFIFLSFFSFSVSPTLYLSISLSLSLSGLIPPPPVPLPTPLVVPPTTLLASPLLPPPPPPPLSTPPAYHLTATPPTISTAVPRASACPSLPAPCPPPSTTSRQGKGQSPSPPLCLHPQHRPCYPPTPPNRPPNRTHQHEGEVRLAEVASGELTRRGALKRLARCSTQITTPRPKETHVNVHLFVSARVKI